jgi:DnaJ-class molecular chaperone
MTTCTQCKGSGKTWIWNEICTHCNGTGRREAQIGEQMEFDFGEETT